MFKRKVMIRTVYAHKRNHDNVAHQNAWLKYYVGICVIGFTESDIEAAKGLLILSSILSIVLSLYVWKQ